jgi:diguanylate cyclase (GGDEF)-like protein
LEDTAGAGREALSLNDDHVQVADDESDAGARVASTLAHLAERLAVALDCSECCFYEYLRERDAVLPKAMWKLELTDDDRAWVGVEHHLNRHAHVAPVFEERRIVVTQVDEEKLDATDNESMAYWGEKTALYAPIVIADKLCGVVELIDHRRRREFGEADLRLVTALADLAALAIANARTVREEELKNRRLGALLQSSRALGSTVILDEVLQRLAEHAAGAIDASCAFIYEYDPLENAVVWRCEYLDDPAFASSDPVGTSYPLDHFPVDLRVIGQREVIETTVDDPDLDERSHALMVKWRHTTLLNVPLVSGDEVVGKMELAETHDRRHFTPAEVELAVAIGEQAAIAIRNAQLYRRESWRNERLVRVLEISRIVGTSLDPAEVIDAVRERLGSVFGDRPTQIAVTHPDAVDVAQIGGSADEPTGSVDTGLADGPTESGDVNGRRLVVPLHAKGRSGSELLVTSPVASPFDRDEKELVQIIANQVAVAMENARLYDQLEEQAITDGLTGLYNHRFFYDRLNAEVARARRYGLELSVLMLDLDDFKRFNDTFGHPAGDRVLAEVGQIMRRQLRREVDIPCRYGGEEFAAILPHTPALGAETVGRRLTEQLMAVVSAEGTGDSAWLTGERLRRTIETVSFPGVDQSTHVTVSVGVATYPDHADDATTLVGNADKALYVAKRSGKNRVEVFAPT